MAARVSGLKQKNLVQNPRLDLYLQYVEISIFKMINKSTTSDEISDLSFATYCLMNESECNKLSDADTDETVRIFLYISLNDNFVEENRQERS